ncbi:MAG: hypothetical protein Q8N77_04705 [Nanoarchaeota archaeon]|nr:hypothetical protein [Nanoarchaeota archaeon]
MGKLEKIVKVSVLGVMTWLAAEGFCYVNAKNSHMNVHEYGHKVVDALKQGDMHGVYEYTRIREEYKKSAKDWEERADMINPFCYAKALKEKLR